MKLAVILAAIVLPRVSAAAPPAPEAAAPTVPASDEEVDDAGLTTADYAAAIDYDVSYDDDVAQSYDDGYDPRAYEQFHDTLAPYGAWVDDPAYGQVWVPSPSVVGDDFSPYATNGDWTDSEYGWTWVSGWTWGWAPFHYGRWTTIANRGWAWVPGTIWGPSWVSWRVGAGCVGWAPLPPRGVHLASPLGAGSSWRFVGVASFGRPHAAYLSPSVVPRVFGRMSVVSNARAVGARGATTRVNAGPPVMRGQPAPPRLTSVAPSVLPRLAVQPRAGIPLASRSWVQAGVTRQLAFSHSPTLSGARVRAASYGTQSPMVRAYTLTGQVPRGDGRSYTLGSGAPRAWERAGAPSFRATATPNLPAQSIAHPAWFYPVGRAYPPRATGSTSTQAPSAPQWTVGAPQFTAGVPRFTATIPFRAPAPPAFQSGGHAPSFGGGHSSWGGAAPAPSGGARSFGGGGGHGFGGGRHR